MHTHEHVLTYTPHTPKREGGAFTEKQCFRNKSLEKYRRPEPLSNCGK